MRTYTTSQYAQCKKKLLKGAKNIYAQSILKFYCFQTNARIVRLIRPPPLSLPQPHTLVSFYSA
jgi:hypothetical protein